MEFAVLPLGNGGAVGLEDDRTWIVYSDYELIQCGVAVGVDEILYHSEKCLGLNLFFLFDDAKIQLFFQSTKFWGHFNISLTFPIQINTKLYEFIQNG